ncbi:ABC transporter ATP-binding protein [Clostridium tyrobutyricum]|uniref:ABC transporter ATP-binding protein n=1 Tax=Clostridium tyrobutyricum TaxID=1519 RepID=UPI0011CB18EC|nr:ABC transporter ATP-binding protein [Clostridium tyrobutyricum]MBV4416026.1 ABC transporter ATP-binding protein [Clostridium tyrobutyricum]MBV4422031.1 ABC transporter ATP-binding protein [Clostridium tyrobutyricum]
MDNILELINTVKKFNGQTVVKDISINIKRGEFLTILGPSGCGKTTTLRMIAGFEKPTSGSIILNGKHIENKEPYELNINTVFQNYALFPHMNVYNNIAYGLKIKKINKQKIKARVENMLKLVQLEGYEKRMPGNLSGGQKQRVAIARALINSPDLLLLDEPLGALDFKLRKQMQIELKRLQKKLGITFVYVTHDQEEALNMSDSIVVMKDGKIEQLGTPRDIYERPRTKFVAGFIGDSNIFDCNVQSIEKDKIYLNNINGTIITKDSLLKKGDHVSVIVRPENIKYSFSPVDFFDLKAIVEENIYLGSNTKTILKLKDGTNVSVMSYTKNLEIPEVGTETWIFWDISDGVLIKGGACN